MPSQPGHSSTVETPLEPVREVGQTFLKHLNYCARSAYLYRTVRGTSHELMRGIAFHDAIERAIKLAVEENERQVPQELVKALLEEVFRRADLTLPWREKDGLRMMAFHWAQAWDVDPEDVLAVEQSLSMRIGEYTVRGRLDLVLRHAAGEQTVAIKDWKTSFAMPDQDEYEGDFQGWFYGMLFLFGTDEDGVCLGDGVQWVECSQEFPRFLREDGRLGYRSMLRTRLELMEFREHVADLLARLDHEFVEQEWEAVRSDAGCAICPAKLLCPLRGASRHAGLINTAAEAAEAASWVDATRDALDATNKELKSWSRANGPVRFGRDLVLEHQLQESRALRRVKGRSDWEGLEAAALAAARYGEPFEVREWVLERQSMAFKKRVLSPGELAAEEEEGLPDAA